MRAVAAILGIYLLLTPLALWIAWSGMALLVLVGGGIGVAIVLLLCGWLTRDRRGGARGGSERPTQIGHATVSDEFLAELSNMGPWIYHNRITADRRFRKKMARLQELLEDDKAGGDSSRS